MKITEGILIYCIKKQWQRRVDKQIKDFLNCDPTGRELTELINIFKNENTVSKRT